MIFEKFIYSNKKNVWPETGDSCKEILAEKMQKVIQKESHKAVEAVNVNQWMGSGVQRNQEEKANIWGTFYVFKWMKTLSLRVSSFALTSICFIIFLFYLHFCLLSNLEIIRCIVKSMIAPSMYL